MDNPRSFNNKKQRQIIEEGLILYSIGKFETRREAEEQAKLSINRRIQNAKKDKGYEEEDYADDGKDWED